MSNVIDINELLSAQYQQRLERVAAKMVQEEREKAKRQLIRKQAPSYKSLIGSVAMAGWIDAGNGRKVEEGNNE